MIGSNLDTTPHNPDRIEPAPRIRKAGAGKWHRLQARQMALAPQARPRQLGRMFAEFGMVVGWSALWLLNGLATALGAAALGSLFASRGLFAGLQRIDWLVIGAVFHLFISAVEQHLWRSDYERPAKFWPRVKAFASNTDRTRLGLAVFIGALDSLSTAWYIRRIIGAFVNPSIGVTVVAALLAGLVALSAEPMVREFGRKVIILFREG